MSDEVNKKSTPCKNKGTGYLVEIKVCDLVRELPQSLLYGSPPGIHKLLFIHFLINFCFTECSAKADVAFLVDGSANIPLPYYARVLEFIKIFSRGFDKSNTHVGLMAYGDNVKTALNLKGINDFKEFDDAVNIAPYIGGKAFTGNALLQMKTALFAISGRQDAPRALILLSSGGSADDVVAPGEELRDSGVKVTAIGLGKQANVRELINIASEPKSEHVFTAFLDTLPNAMDDIIQGVCRGKKH